MCFIHLLKDIAAANHSATLPTYDGLVMAKVLSLDSDAACLKRKALLRRKQHTQSTDNDSAFLAPAPTQSNKKSEVLASTSAPPRATTQENVQHDHEERSPSPPPPKEHNFFNTSGDEYETTSSVDSKNVSAQSGNGDTPPAVVLDRAALAQKRQNDIDAQVAAALAEKKDVCTCI